MADFRGMLRLLRFFRDPPLWQMMTRNYPLGLEASVG